MVNKVNKKIFLMKVKFILAIAFILDFFKHMFKLLLKNY